MCSTAGNLKRSISCQEDKCVIAWSCGKDPATNTATDSNPSRHHQAQKNNRSTFAHGRRSHPAKTSRACSSNEEIADIKASRACSSAEETADIKGSRACSSTEEISDTSSGSAKSKHQEDDFDGKIEAEQEHKREECRYPTEMASTGDIVETSVQSYNILVDSCCKQVESNTGTDTESDNITESRTTIQTPVSIVSPAEEDATGVSVEIVSDNITESRTTVETLVSTVSPAEDAAATSVFVETVSDNIKESRTTIETPVSNMFPAEENVTCVSVEMASDNRPITESRTTVETPVSIVSPAQDDAATSVSVETVSDNITEIRAIIDIIVSNISPAEEDATGVSVEMASDNIMESRTTVEILVSIASPAEDAAATSVSVESVALPTDVSCDINEDVLLTEFEISNQQLSRTAVEEADSSKAANSDGDRPFEDASWCIYDGATSTKLTRQDLDDRLSVTKRRGRHKGRSQRIGRKWKPIAEDVVQLDFQMSLFPRNVSAEVDADINSAAILKELENFERSLDSPGDADAKSSTENGSGIMADPKQTNGCEKDCSDIQNCGENLEHPEQKSSEDNKSLSINKVQSTSTKDDVFDYEDTDDLMSFYADKVPHFIRSSVGNEPYLPECQRLRMKKKWKTPKARIQVKTKHCRTLNNTVHGRPIYINFRVMLRMHMELRSLYSNPYFRTLSLKKIDKCKGLPVGGVKDNNGSSHSARNKDASPRHPPAGSHFAMDAYNADSDLSADLVNILVNIQHRELLPEDYELLLRLDERVAQKTIDSSVLSTLKTEVVGPEGRAEPCAICMEPYEAGHTMKYLPCGHCYHDACIDRWLSNSSPNCPLDGVPIDEAL